MIFSPLLWRVGKSFVTFAGKNQKRILPMPNFFKSFFSGKSEDALTEKQKINQKNFDIFKYDGLRAMRMGRADYAVKCFVEALAIEEDFETMNYLAHLYVQTGQLEEARTLLHRMEKKEPQNVEVLLLLANVCYMLEDYKSMSEAAGKAIALEEGNAMAHFLLGKACQGEDDELMAIAHLTKAITLKEDFVEARLLRGEALFRMKQYKEAQEDVEAVLAQDASDESALILRGNIAEATGRADDAVADYKQVISINPFNRQAYLALGRLYIATKQLAEAVTLFDEAIELSPDFAEAYKERGRAKLLNGDKEGALADMKKSMELNPQEEAALNGEFHNLEPKQDTLPGIF